MTPPGSITVWIAKLRENDPEAAEQLWRRYFARLVELARLRLGRLPRPVSDEEDVVLSAFDSFFRGVGEGRFPRLDNRDDLWQALLAVTERKRCTHVQHFTRQKRDVRRTVQQEAILDGVPDDQPGPEFALDVAEELRELLAGLRSDEYRQVALLSLDGLPPEEIAERLGLSVHTIRRKLALIRQTLERGRPA